MEAAGLAIGTLALVGVFEDCVALLSQIGAAKSMEKDYVLLATRLDLQRTLLLQWAGRLNLFDSNSYDARLKNPTVGPLLEQGLLCIRQLLQDGHSLQQRYGVRPVGVKERLASSSAISSRLMFRFRRKSSDLRLRRSSPSSSRPLTNNDEHTHSSFTKIKWVIKDKEQFECLVRKLSDLIADLDKIIPPQTGPGIVGTGLRDEVERLDNVRELMTILAVSSEDNTDLVDVTKRTIDKKCVQLVLNRLCFRLIDDRKDNITEAHSNTFEWAIHPPASGVAWSDLGEWLRSGSEIYWISGKPGSGKSTLMKYLYNHPDVMNLLQEWAGDRKLTVAPFFLWNIGSTEQSSQQGLARGLLYHVLKENPTLIPAILPHTWQEAQNGIDDLQVPTDAELRAAFQRLDVETTGGAFAFFIDGLDEFTGNHREGISFVKSLAANANMKILVSSRPIDTCVAALSSAPRLRLHDLTKPDIETYINDVVRSRPCAAEYKYLTDTAVEGLVDDIRRKADGVFLWVVLACRTLLEGFAACDSVEELQRRIEELPPELDDLFRHILNSLEARFLQQAAKILRVCYTYYSLNLDHKLAYLPLAWAHENDMDIDALETFTRYSLGERGRKCAMLQGRLRSRCRGLVEVYENSDEGFYVDFMHRTVFEFLYTSDAWTMDCLQIDDDQFDATTILAYMGCYRLYLESPWAFDGMVMADNCELVRAVENSSPPNLSRVLKRFAFALLQAEDKLNHPDLGVFHQDVSFDDAVLLLAVELGCTACVRKQDVQDFNTRQRLLYDGSAQRSNLLYHAMQVPVTSDPSSHAELSNSIDTMIEFLLDSGCDPNVSMLDPDIEGFATPWELWIRSGAHNRYNLSMVQAILITVSMLNAGAAFAPQVLDTSTKRVEYYRKGAIEIIQSWHTELPEKFAGPENAEARETLLKACEEIESAIFASLEDNSD